MSFHVFFSFSGGLARPLSVPKGTKQSIIAQVERVEAGLSLKRTSNGPGHSVYWDYESRRAAGIDNKLLCETVERHNQWVRYLYEQFAEWASTPTVDGETLTPEEAAGFWHGLELLTVSPDRWTANYYRARMESLYETMRGRASEGVSFDERALTPRQAASVIRLFEQYLDPGDLRLDVPHGHDYLASSYDGGYDYCGTCCRPMLWEDAVCCRRRKCELREEAA